ncbi:MAG: methyltransferase domain-containing protein [Actinomycetota bacterium]|nr:methyltransferase domain-containing protein [Actinomycetota bacterium]
MSGAEAKWRRAMKALAIPPEILEAAPESPYGFPAAIWGRPAEPVDSPSRARALEALPEGGSVLDVGAGGGAASLALVPHVAHVTAVDESEALLEAFAANAANAANAGAAGVEHSAIIGRWPDVAPQAPSADVVVCHHVFYNALDLVAFAGALTGHARKRVVAELTATHPLDGFSDLWRHFHGIDRPRGPDADDAIAVLAETGTDVQSERSERPSIWTDAPRSAVVGFVRRRLCLRPENDPEIDALIGDTPERTPRQMVTLYWPGSA